MRDDAGNNPNASDVSSDCAVLDSEFIASNAKVSDGSQPPMMFVFHSERIG